jgi:hypothetical protein
MDLPSNEGGKKLTCLSLRNSLFACLHRHRHCIATTEARYRWKADLTLYILQQAYNINVTYDQ